MSPPSSWLASWLAFALALLRSLFGGLLRAPVAAAVGLTEAIEIVPATAEQLLGVRHAVLRQGLPAETARFAGDDDPSTRHWAAMRQGMVIGCVTVVASPLPDAPPGMAAARQLRGMAVLPEYRGQGLGGALLTRVHHDEPGALWCNARLAAQSLYAKHGWLPVGEPYDIRPLGPHQRMRRGA